MAESEQSYFSFAKGINTEASLPSWPEGFSVDEENYDLYIDGSRRKRKGLAYVGTAYTLGQSTTTANEQRATGSFHWKAAAGDPNLNFVCKQIGSTLYVYDDVAGDLLDANLRWTYNLADVAVTGATSVMIASDKIDMDFGVGVAFVVGKYLTPISITYSSTAFTVAQIDIQERDFHGYDDGVALNEYPLTLSDEHKYNLQNRGWKDADIATFFTGQAKYPNKSLVPWLGYRRITTAGVAEADWTKQFSDAKLIAELFQDVSAPQGHFKISPFTGSVSTSSGLPVSVSTWIISTTTAGAVATVTVDTVSAHGLAPGNTFSWSGNEYLFWLAGGGWYPGTATGSLDGTYTVDTAPSGTRITFLYTVPALFASFAGWLIQYLALGSLGGAATSPNYTAFRPETTCFFAGRVWYMGMMERLFSNKLYFSQIIAEEAQYGKCYQVADPTDERISDIIPSDGGTLVIPEAQGIKQALVVGNSMLIFGTNGIWQIAPGSTGYFSPTNYSVRKVSDQGIQSKEGVCLAEQIPYVCGPTDIFRISQDPNQGFLYAENLSQTTIHTLYNSIPHTRKALMKLVYDELAKKIWMAYGDDPTSIYYSYCYNKALIFDIRLEAFTKHSFTKDVNKYITDIHIVPYMTDLTKTVCVTAYGTKIGNNLYWGYHNLSGTDYKDFGTAFTSYLITGYVTVGNPSRRKQTPYIWVFSKKTETGYTPSGLSLIPVNESSTKMQIRFDWADLAVAGKWGQEQEVYRHPRLYTPTGGSDTFDDGQPLIITKNLVRGSGRSVHIKFSNNTESKDSWLAGWHTNYLVSDGK